MEAGCVNPQTHLTALEKIAAGEANAVAECILLYGRLVWSLARRLTRSAADAEDAVQEIFLSLWTHAKNFDRTKGNEIGFVATIARRRLIDRRRQSNGECDIDHAADIADVPDQSDAHVDCQVQIDALTAVAMLQQLRPEWREVLELSLMAGMTQIEISEHLSVPLGTVKSNIRRGILQLRDMLEVGAKESLALVGDARQPRRSRKAATVPLQLAGRRALMPA